MKVYLDGIPLYYPTAELEKPNFTFRKKDETGDRAFSYTGDLTFTGKDYDYLYSRLVTAPDALENKVIMKFVNDCCSQLQTYEFYITHESMKWCEEECECSCSAIEKSLADDQFTCLKNTLIWDDYAGFKSVQHPRFSYCNELRPNWLHDALIILTMATWTSFLVFGPVLIVIAAVIVVINFIIGINNTIINALNSVLPSGSEINNVDPIDIDGDPSTNAFSEFDNWIKNLLNASFGCGRKHPSPLVKDYITNFCGKCGLSFKSTILYNTNSDYYWTAYVNAPINKGTLESDTTTYWIEENRPLLSGLQFMDQISPVWNAKFEIVASQLIFERKDFFIPKTPWLDLTIWPADKVCWTWSQRTRYSYANEYYQKDGVNWVGSEAVARWGDIIDWNTSPYSPLQKGEYKPFLEFAACRFRDDGIDRDVLTFYEDLPTIGTQLKKYKNSMIMNSHTCYLPMLLIWDPDSGTENATTNKFTNIYYPGLAGVVGANQYYNFPMWFKDGYPGNLHDRFHAIENPRVSGFQGFDFEAEVQWDCALLSAVDVDGVVRTTRGDSKGPLTINMNFANNVLTIKGTV